MKKFAAQNYDYSNTLQKVYKAVKEGKVSSTSKISNWTDLLILGLKSGQDAAVEVLEKEKNTTFTYKGKDFTYYQLLVEAAKAGSDKALNLVGTLKPEDDSDSEWKEILISAAKSGNQTALKHVLEKELGDWNEIALAAALSDNHNAIVFVLNKRPKGWQRVLKREVDKKNPLAVQIMLTEQRLPGWEKSLVDYVCQGSGHFYGYRENESATLLPYLEEVSDGLISSSIDPKKHMAASFVDFILEREERFPKTAQVLTMTVFGKHRKRLLELRKRKFDISKKQTVMEFLQENQEQTKIPVYHGTTVNAWFKGNPEKGRKPINEVGLIAARNQFAGHIEDEVYMSTSREYAIAMGKRHGAQNGWVLIEMRIPAYLVFESMHKTPGFRYSGKFNELLDSTATTGNINQALKEIIEMGMGKGINEPEITVGFSIPKKYFYRVTLHNAVPSYLLDKETSHSHSLGREIGSIEQQVLNWERDKNLTKEQILEIYNDGQISKKVMEKMLKEKTASSLVRTIYAIEEEEEEILDWIGKTNGQRDRGVNDQLAQIVKTLQSTPTVRTFLMKQFIKEQQQRRRKILKETYITLFGRKDWLENLQERQGLDFTFTSYNTEKYKDIYGVDMPPISVHLEKGKHLKDFAPDNWTSGEKYIKSAPLGGELWQANVYVDKLPGDLQQKWELFVEMADMQDLHTRGLKPGYIGWIRGTQKDDILFVDEIQSDVFQRLDELKDPSRVLQELSEEINEIAEDLYEKKAFLAELQQQLKIKVEWTEEDKARYNSLIARANTLTPEEKSELKELGRKRNKASGIENQRVQQQIDSTEKHIENRLKEIKPKTEKIKEFSELTPFITEIYEVEVPYYSSPKSTQLGEWGQKVLYPKYHSLYVDVKNKLQKTYLYALFNTAFRVAQAKRLKYVYVDDNKTTDAAGDLMFHKYYGAMAQKLGGKPQVVPGTIGDFHYNNESTGHHESTPSTYYVFDMATQRVANRKVTMIKNQKVYSLLQLADQLDQKQLLVEANDVDKILRKAADFWDKEFKINQVIKAAWDQWRELVAPEKDKEGNQVKGNEEYMERIKKFIAGDRTDPSLKFLPQDFQLPAPITGFEGVDSPEYELTGGNVTLPAITIDYFGGNIEETAKALVKFIEFYKKMVEGKLEEMQMEPAYFLQIAISAAVFLQYYSKDASNEDVAALLGTTLSDDALRELVTESAPSGVNSLDWEAYEIWEKQLGPIEVRRNEEVKESVKQKATELGVKLVSDEEKKTVDDDIEKMLSGIENAETEASIIKRLVQLADRLDRKQLFVEADKITKLILAFPLNRTPFTWNLAYDGILQLPNTEHIPAALEELRIKMPDLPPNEQLSPLMVLRKYYDYCRAKDPSDPEYMPARHSSNEAPGKVSDFTRRLQSVFPKEKPSYDSVRSMVNIYRDSLREPTIEVGPYGKREPKEVASDIEAANYFGSVVFDIHAGLQEIKEVDNPETLMSDRGKQVVYEPSAPTQISENDRRIGIAEFKKAIAPYKPVCEKLGFELSHNLLFKLVPNMKNVYQKLRIQDSDIGIKPFSTLPGQGLDSLRIMKDFSNPEFRDSIRKEDFNVQQYQEQLNKPIPRDPEELLTCSDPKCDFPDNAGRKYKRKGYPGPADLYRCPYCVSKRRAVLIKQLISLANILDRKGFIKEADLVDELLKVS